MKKKFFVTAILLAIFSLALITCSFAENGMDGAVNGVRNFVGGAENVVEDAGKDAANGIRSGLNAIGEGANNVANGMDENNRGSNNDGMMANDNMGTNGYTATRTSTDAGTGAGLFGATSNTVWTWLIIAIVGIVIAALIIYYVRQNANVTTYNHDDDDYNK